ncbi:MAG: DivIVA domain-containing protein [bacterium]|nr:DivIVA domain-containing protein [bacterium]
MDLTPIEIQQYKFSSSVWGYSRGEVERFLESIALEEETLRRENQDLKEKMIHSQSTINEMQKQEAHLREALISAQTITENMKQEAQHEADLILKEAQLKAQQIISTAQEQRFAIETEINRLHQQKRVFQANLGALLENHRRLLDNEDVSTVRVPPVTADDDVVQISEADQLPSYPPVAS